MRSAVSFVDNSHFPKTATVDAISICLLICRKCEIESSTLSHRRLDPDAAPIALDDALTDRKTDASTRDRAPVKPLEYAENRQIILRLDSDAIVGYRETPFVVSMLGGEVNTGRTQPKGPRFESYVRTQAFLDFEILLALRLTESRDWRGKTAGTAGRLPAMHRSSAARFEFVRNRYFNASDFFTRSGPDFLKRNQWQRLRCYDLYCSFRMGQRTRAKAIAADNPAVDQYYALLTEYRDQRIKHEGAVSTAFENLLTTLANRTSQFNIADSFERTIP